MFWDLRELDEHVHQSPPGRVQPLQRRTRQPRRRKKNGKRRVARSLPQRIRSSRGRQQTRPLGRELCGVVGVHVGGPRTPKLTGDCSHGQSRRSSPVSEGRRARTRLANTNWTRERSRTTYLIRQRSGSRQRVGPLKLPSWVSGWPAPDRAGVSGKQHESRAPLPAAKRGREERGRRGCVRSCR
jgi:hypothetical protein